MDKKKIISIPFKRSRWLIHALILSTALNLGLIATFVYFALKKTPYLSSNLAISSEIMIPRKKEHAQVIASYLNLSFNKLIEQLSCREWIGQGYRAADLALSCLVACYGFDIDRALPDKVVERRPFAMADPRQENATLYIDLFPGISDEEMQVIRTFAHYEMWPLTSRGLFEELQRREQSFIPKSLKETFFLSHEFYVIQRAFMHSPLSIDRDALLFLLLEGSWDMMSDLFEQIEKDPKGHLPALGSFLAQYQNSKQAAYWLIALDPNFAYEHLEDHQLMNLLSQLNLKLEESIVFCKRLLTSLRSEQIRNEAKRLLGVASLSKTSQLTYVIKKGDTLWQIARDFKIALDVLKKWNQLDSEKLYPGQVLTIPKDKTAEEV